MRFSLNARRMIVLLACGCATACAALLSIDDVRYQGVVPDAAGEGSADAPGPPADAAADAGDSAADVRFCETVDATFCADFDGVYLDEGFNMTPDKAAGGHFDASTDSWRSPPRALLAWVEPHEAGANAASLVRLFDPAGTDLRLRFEVQLVQEGGTELVSLGAVRFVDRVHIALDYNREGGVTITQLKLPVAEAGAIVALLPLPASVYQALHRGEWVALDLHVDTVNGTIQATVGDGVVDAALLPEVTGADAATALLYLGTSYAQAPHTGWAARFDNVIVDFR